MLKDMVAREHDIIDQEIQGIAGSLSSVSKWEKFGLHKFSIVTMK